MTQINSCGAFLSSGLGDCNSRFQPIIGTIISAKNTTYTAAELATIAKTKTNISLAAGIVSIYIPISGFKDNTAAPSPETSATGVKSIFTSNVPDVEIYLDRTFDDLRTFWNLNSTIVDVEFITQDRMRLMTPVSNGSWKGFRGQIYTPYGFPKFDNNQEAHPIFIYFKDVSEFMVMEALPMNYSGSEIEALVPVGINLRANAAYNGTSGEIVLKATKRGSAVGYAGLDVWVIVDSNVAGGVVTAVAGTDGSYTVKALKNTTDELVDDDYVTVQANKTVSTYATFITNPLRIDGKTP
jgi:hypothetical protein